MPAVSLAILAMTGTALHLTLDRVQRASLSAQHTQQVRQESADLLSLLKDAETGQRGYLLTGNKRYLQPYYRAVQGIDPKIQALRTLVSNNPGQLRRLDTLEREVKAKLAELRQTVDLRSSKGLEAALQIVRTDQGQQLMEDIRQIAQGLQDQENRLLQQHSEQAETKFKNMVAIVITGSLLSFGFVAFTSFVLNQDLIKRTKVEQALRRNKEQLQQALEAARMGTWDWDILSDKFTWSNDEQLFGLAPGTFKGTYEAFADCVHADDREAVAQAINRARLERHDYHQEFRVVWPDGSIHWVEAKGKFFYDPEGKPVRLIGTVMDISEPLRGSLRDRKQAEVALHKSKQELEIKVAFRTVELAQANQELQRELLERQQAEAAHNRLIAILEATPDFIATSDTRGQVLYLNRAARSIFGSEGDEEISNFPLWDAQTEWAAHLVLDEGLPTAASIGIWSGETAFLSQDGREIPTSQVILAHKAQDGEVDFFSTIVRDITERKKIEEQIRASLTEKEVLLKEIHHRVKNNLQIISGLLYLQSRYVEDKKTLQVLQENRDRIQSMALLHEKLYCSQNLDKIDFRDYINSLTTNLFISCGVNQDVIALKLNIEPVCLDIDTAIPCGLIVNELVSNSLKHAFPHGRRGEIAIEFLAPSEKSFELIVRDNGVGFAGELDFQNKKSLGLRLVYSLAN